ncbi:hypothetical protein B0A52_07479 [Exophiala mesophila]|uniref:Glutathione S-transferase n=1 Tax=Exophiala mesophila TaxID=212818 RepID=A0A438MYK8_EXOME|nr:hypothetical protein B0A52_07479 [Exophiala mesophila]
MSGPPFNALTLYTAGTPNGFKPTAVLEELGLKYDAVAIDMFKNEQKEPWFIDINPNGRIPALKDGDLRVFESGAIMLYLFDQYDKDKVLGYDISKGGKEAELYYEMMSWLMFQMAGVGPMQGQANHFQVMAPVYSAYGIKRYTDETRRLISVLELRLSKADWLAGDKYTLADIANYSWVSISPLLDVDLSEYPGVQRWIDRISARDAVKRAKLVPQGKTLGEEGLKEMFDKGKQRLAALKGTDKQDS